jgi:RNA polymerase sigma-70 factor (TIGR02960 family)
MDEPAFNGLVDRHRRELHVHCYRMLGSFDDAEDIVQETYLRAWRARDSMPDADGLRPWLYRIATNACIDVARRRSRQVPSLSSFAEVPWLQPYPDQLLDEVAPSDEQPDAVVVARETIELAFMAAIQLLPPQQRAILILRDVLGWSAAESAQLLETSVAAANSALQRARATLRGGLPERSDDWSAAAPTAEERALAQRYVEAHGTFDPQALATLVADDVRVTMPPMPLVYDGIAALRPLFDQAKEMGEWRLVATSANRQPAAASYLRRPDDTEFRAFKLDVMRLRGTEIAEITTFDPHLFPAFGLPEILSGQ